MSSCGYQTYFTGKWHLGEADYSLPNAQGYDVMKYVGLYHLNAYTYADPTWFPDMDPELRAMFQKMTIGALSGKAGQKPVEDFKINGQYVDTPVINGKEGVVGCAVGTSYGYDKSGKPFLTKEPKLLLNDARREYAYGPAKGLPATKVGAFTQALYDQAKKQGWTVISMKDDWKRVFAFE